MPYGSLVKDGFYARIAELGGTVIDEWKGSNTPHHVICANGHDCYPCPANIYRGRQKPCLTCIGRTSSAAWADFVNEVESYGGTVIEENWLGSKIPHRCICPKGHETAVFPNHVRTEGVACRVCQYSKKSSEPISRATYERFIQILAENGAHLIGEWKGVGKPHHVRCVNNHDCYPHPNSILHGQGICIKCAGRIWDVFYIVHNRHANRIKFGITSGDPRARLANHRAFGYAEQICVLTNLPGEFAKSIEDECRIALRNHGFTPIRGREYFNADALPVILATVEALAPQ
jgi:hypothetical protein